LIRFRPITDGRVGLPGRAKARVWPARQNQKGANPRRDCLHQLSRARIRTADWHLYGMVKNSSLAKALSMIGRGIFRSMLAYDGDRSGADVPSADRC